MGRKKPPRSIQSDQEYRLVQHRVGADNNATDRRNRVRNCMLQALDAFDPGDWSDAIEQDLLSLTDRIHLNRPYESDTSEVPVRDKEQMMRIASQIRREHEAEMREGDDES